MYESWQLAHTDHHPVAADLEEIAAECVELCRLLVRAWSIREDRLFSTGPGVLEDITAVLDRATTKSLDIVGSFLKFAEDAARGYQQSESIDLLRRELASLRSAKDKAIRIDFSALRGQVEQSQRDVAAGNYWTIEELIDQWPSLEGQHVPKA